jgi:hypothetical protein
VPHDIVEIGERRDRANERLVDIVKKGERDELKQGSCISLN